MHTQQYALALAALLPYAMAHGVITSITGANGVTMPGLSVVDGTPRDCATPGCGAEADTTIFRGGSPLGHTAGGNSVNAETNVAMFISGTAPSAAASTAAGSTSGSSSGSDALASLLGDLRRRDYSNPIAGLLTGGDSNIGDILTGENTGLEGDAAGAATGAAISGLEAASSLAGLGRRDSGNPISDAVGGGADLLTGGDENAGDILTGENTGLEGDAAGAATGAVISGLQAASNLAGIGRRQSAAQGTETPSGTSETLVGSSAGTGAKSGLPTADDNGIVTLNLHQVNQDGAGPYTASVDSTSGGADESAFKPATVMDNVGGLASLSLVTTTDFPVKVQMPQGTVCSGTVAGVKNVCIVRMMNSALAGPFGGTAAFTQTPAQAKRAEEYLRIKRSRVARNME